MSQNRQNTDFKNVVATCGLVQSVGYCSNRVLADIRFLNKKFGWTKYNENVMANLPFKLCVPIRILGFIGIKYNVGPKTILI